MNNKTANSAADALCRIADVAEHAALMWAFNISGGKCDPEAMLEVLNRHTGCPLCKVLRAKVKIARQQKE